MWEVDQNTLHMPALGASRENRFFAAWGVLWHPKQPRDLDDDYLDNSRNENRQIRLLPGMKVKVSNSDNQLRPEIFVIRGFKLITRQDGAHL